MTALTVLDVSASEKRAVSANCGWYRGRNAFRPDCGMKGLFFYSKLVVNLLGGISMKEQLEQIKANALTALEAAEIGRAHV